MAEKEESGKALSKFVHDMNNVLALLLLYCDRALGRAQGQEELAKDLAMIREGIAKATSLNLGLRKGAVPAATEPLPTVLVVEDEDALRELIASIISQAGYEVIVAKDGAEALHLCESLGVGIGALVTDIELPELSGVELVKQALLFHPDLKVVYMSGHVTVEGSSFPQLQKPFSADALLSALRRSLTAVPPRS